MKFDLYINESILEQLTIKEIKQLAENGQVTHETAIKKQGHHFWIKAGAFPSIRPFLKSRLSTSKAKRN